jgi:hypothetical protein
MWQTGIHPKEKGATGASITRHWSVDGKHLQANTEQELHIKKGSRVTVHTAIATSPEIVFQWRGGAPAMAKTIPITGSWIDESGLDKSDPWLSGVVDSNGIRAWNVIFEMNVAGRYWMPPAQVWTQEGGRAWTHGMWLHVKEDIPLGG